jgi:hypothetical protein
MSVWESAWYDFALGSKGGAYTGRLSMGRLHLKYPVSLSLKYSCSGVRMSRRERGRWRRR